MKYLLAKPALAAAFLAFAVSVRADPIDVNFFSGNFGGSAATGPGVIGNTGDLWNGLNGDSGSGVSGNLADTSGKLTGVTLSYDAPGGGAVVSLNINNQPNPSLMNDYLFNKGGGEIFFTINNLAPRTTYDLYVYAASGDGGAGNRVAFLRGSSASNFVTGVPMPSFVEGQNYALLTPTTDANGSLTIVEDPNFLTGNEIDLNGLQIAIIPEQTATLPLLALSAAGLLLLARRNQIVAALKPRQLAPCPKPARRDRC